jgi:hypothetical protein
MSKNNALFASSVILLLIITHCVILQAESYWYPNTNVPGNAGELSVRAYLFNFNNNYFNTILRLVVLTGIIPSSILIRLVMLLCGSSDPSVGFAVQSVMAITAFCIGCVISFSAFSFIVSTLYNVIIVKRNR